MRFTHRIQSIKFSFVDRVAVLNLCARVLFLQQCRKVGCNVAAM